MNFKTTTLVIALATIDHVGVTTAKEPVGVVTPVDHVGTVAIVGVGCGSVEAVYAEGAKVDWDDIQSWRIGNSSLVIRDLASGS